MPNFFVVFFGYHKTMSDPALYPRISSLSYYPIKGCARVKTQELVLDEWGAYYDRRWMIVGEEPSVFYTQRELPRLTLLTPQLKTIKGTNYLRVPTYFHGTLELPILPDEDLAPRPATVWGYTAPALDEGDEAAKWFTHALKTPCRLVRAPRNWPRRPENAPESPVAFADSHPLLLTNYESFRDLNNRLAERGQPPTQINRFRANILVSGWDAWAEDSVNALQFGENSPVLQAGNGCARCSVVTIDQTTGSKNGPEPLATLATFRRNAEGKVTFGRYFLPPKEPTVLRVGDALRTVSRP